jgi:hypothetical protein
MLEDPVAEIAQCPDADGGIVAAGDEQFSRWCESDAATTVRMPQVDFVDKVGRLQHQAQQCQRGGHDDVAACLTFRIGPQTPLPRSEPESEFHRGQQQDQEEHEDGPQRDLILRVGPEHLPAFALRSHVQIDSRKRD